ncbi:uncharacterized protein L203_102086 [Cryptococcus depauperatus CBS 7841]|uniref:MRP family ATP-binding protein n=1 Tax=Cryptococcus depauperatus CBS 7841 TaxID=1295531 RepID=A0AAJ8M0U3_9TREE
MLSIRLYRQWTQSRPLHRSCLRPSHENPLVSARPWCGLTLVGHSPPKSTPGAVYPAPGRSSSKISYKRRQANRRGGEWQRRRRKEYGGAPRIGLLDLDVFGPSVPKLMGLEDVGEPMLSDEKKLLPLQNHGIKTMSIGYLIGLARGVAGHDGDEGPGTRDDLDVLVIDMPPGTGDVQLSLGQLVAVDGAVVVSTPQDVALADARKGIIGLLLNMSHYTCSSCATRHELFGSCTKFEKAAQDLRLDVLGKVPLITSISDGGDAGRPVMVQNSTESKEVQAIMQDIGQHIWKWLASHTPPSIGARG